MYFSSLLRASAVLLTLTFALTGCSKGQSQVTGSAATTTSAAQPAPTATPQADAGLSYTTKRGDTVAGLARQFLPQSSLMTASELDAAIRKANNLGPKTILKPGQTLTIPTLEKQPIVEKPVYTDRASEIRAIYLTGDTAGSDKGLQIIRHWKQVGGNAVVFDIKDSDGLTSIAFDHPLAPKNHHAITNLPKFVRWLHQQNLHAIARIALFRDEHIAKQHPELAVQSRANKAPWKEKGKQVWADTSNPEVQNYNLALAKYVAGSGADEIQFDYVRFPAEGDQADAKWYFQTSHPNWQRSDVLADFLTRAYGELHPMGVLVSLDVFGVMAWQRKVDLARTGQDIPRLAKLCDVLSPMIYPSHFFGMDGYALPGDAPEHFIGTSMERYREVTDGTGVTLRPWLQAFAWRTKTYSPEYILKQVRTSREYGGVGFLFWNARNDYSKPYVAMPIMTANAKEYLETPEAKKQREEWAKNFEANGSKPMAFKTTFPAAHKKPQQGVKKAVALAPNNTAATNPAPVPVPTQAQATAVNQ